jgi:indole-3-glycerol phosphate synthase
MEAFILTCLQAQLMVGKINANRMLSQQEKNGLIMEIKLVSPKTCPIDAKAD